MSGAGATSAAPSTVASTSTPAVASPTTTPVPTPVPALPTTSPTKLAAPSEPQTPTSTAEASCFSCGFVLPETAAFYDTPSRADGLSPEDERNTQAMLINFVTDLCKLLDLIKLVSATASILFHRYFASHSFVREDPYLIAVSCVFLASKIEESPRKMKQCMFAHHFLLHCRLPEGEKDLKSVLEEYMRSNPDRFRSGSEEEQVIRENILRTELRILQCIGFDLSVVPPYKYIVEAKKRCLSKGVPESALKAMFQYAWNFINDSFRTNVCLAYSPLLVAAACIRLTRNVSEVMFQPDEYLFEDPAYVSSNTDKVERISNIIIQSYRSVTDMSSVSYAEHRNACRERRHVWRSRTEAAAGKSSQQQQQPSSSADSGPSASSQGSLLPASSTTIW